MTPPIKSDVADRANFIKNLFLMIAILLTGLLIYASFRAFRLIPTDPSTGFSLLALYGLACFVPILLGWLSFRRIGMIIFASLATAGSLIHCIVTTHYEFLSFPVCYFILFIYVIWVDKRHSDEVVISEIEIEKQYADKNDLEILFKEKGKSISVHFEKYSTYYNLRRLADEFATTLELARLGDIIVQRSLEFVQRGALCLLSVASTETETISLIASYSVNPVQRTKKKLGDVFDLWVLRNRQHLLVIDTQKDFRFDLKKTAPLEDTRSVILSPLLHEGKVMGTLRINAVTPDTFNAEHLRLLDAISTLASSAVSNAMLYARTEELAIRDSLTRLYVHRYFKQRLKQEHRRTLLTNQPLSLLVCDLDFFKRINDQHGHAIGDLVLVQAAEALRRFCDHGIVARYGGEEFTILLPQTNKKEARVLAEKIRRGIEAEHLEIRRKMIPLTVSIGVATIPDDTLDSEELLRTADNRLYEAKRLGRNRVC